MIRSYYRQQEQCIKSLIMYLEAALELQCLNAGFQPVEGSTPREQLISDVTELLDDCRVRFLKDMDALEAIQKSLHDNHDIVALAVNHHFATPTALGEAKILVRQEDWKEPKNAWGIWSAPRLISRCEHELQTGVRNLTLNLVQQ